MAEHHVRRLDMVDAEREVIQRALTWDASDSAAHLRQLRQAIRQLREAQAAYEAVRPTAHWGQRG